MVDENEDVAHRQPVFFPEVELRIIKFDSRLKGLRFGKHLERTGFRGARKYFTTLDQNGG